MPHAVRAIDLQAEQDEAIIAALINDDQSAGNFDFMSRDLEVGDKADDAVDFEDIGDDDLAEDEDELEDKGNGAGDDDNQDLSGLFSDLPGDDGLDDLFGDGAPSSPIEQDGQKDSLLQAAKSSDGVAKPSVGSGEGRGQPNFRDVNYGATVEDDDEDNEQDEEVQRLKREQLLLFAAALRDQDERNRRGPGGPELLPPPQTNPEIFEQLWPHFEPDKPPRFAELIPLKRAHYIAKTPLKPPKPIQPTKVNLDIQQDQERSFRLPSTIVANKSAHQADADQNGIVIITDGRQEQDDDDDEMELDDFDQGNDEEMVGGVTLRDLNVICQDWEIPSPDAMTVDEEEVHTPPVEGFVDDDDWTLEGRTPPAKKHKVGTQKFPKSIPIYNNLLPSFDDPEFATARLARRVLLDLNDPQLLIDIQPPSAELKKPLATTKGFKGGSRGNLAGSVLGRYNISNDEAYDALKENHSHKIRSTLGHMAVEHGMPALKLQYPFYQFKLSDREARSFHRPTFHCKAGERATIMPNKSLKRKRIKNLKPQELYQTAEDLTLADNSTMLLAEYSEEYPIMLSNFAMGNKIINYYRRKDNEDTARPKYDIGETAVLLPQDKSPFSIFGNVEPGQTVPALHNAMFRAPVFKHDAKGTDFLVCRSHTGVEGSKWYLRNIENLMVVGQEFPSVEVPGTHSRKVTEAGKKRLKMLSFRLYQKHQKADARQPWVSNAMIQTHLPGTEVSQNRSRMREIMQYNKDNTSWEPKDGETIPDEDVLRTWIKPEDICLIDSMQVGDRHLQDAGFNKEDIAIESTKEEEGQSLEQKLAPWQITKNFLNACQEKAMLELHGEGDPSGRGEAFSFIKVSMKGGFKDVGESVGDKLDAKKVKELGGHSYNVARQQRQYKEAIKRIWNAQTQSLSSTLEHSDAEVDVDHVEGDHNIGRGKTPRSEFGTPSAFHRDDETTSQFSRFSNASQTGKVLRITRYITNQYGKVEEDAVIVRDPKVIREYIKQKRGEELEKMDIQELKPTGDPNFDRSARQKLVSELARLQRNAERREVREKAKGQSNLVSSTPATPASPTGGPSKGQGTQRKCANCGQVGHIRTNKKLCPMLNGTSSQNDMFEDTAFASPVGATATPSAS
ncbi:hypothetical protein K432DRAFT_376983 [Lepidopterella palustris CBS 459.81]|uniref:Transcription initiation factor TFIID subunit 1 histone acetyltransferase domain-containing protein n=1 Tax=Lepidopterella palustris CBS 459.81 TaxID=1314670 RepID=A0A8E2ELF0_9PEZI|nr:hypothetical protein K432DRAFT_376983 [Lepidopterella palustris CBS 459.81]